MQDYNSAPTNLFMSVPTISIPETSIFTDYQSYGTNYHLLISITGHDQRISKKHCRINPRLNFSKTELLINGIPYSSL